MSDANGLLRKWVDFGLDYRIETNPRFEEHFFANEDAYIKQINHEYDTVSGLDFSDYFLACSDIVRYAKDVLKMPVGPGRGSAAGSLLCYTIRITEINPMRFPLMMFERFIDPGRPDYPDIDMDFADPSKIFQYAEQKYGVGKVAHIGNFMRWRGRSAVKDIGKVYQIAPADYEPLRKLVIDRPDGDPRENDSVEDTIEAFEEARRVVEKHPEFRYAQELEGNYRNLGMHAAGMVISNRPIEETCAIYIKEKTKASDDDVVDAVIPYDKRDAEYLGMLKLDILGLKTMAIIGDALEMINDPNLTMDDFYIMEFDDEKTLDGFRNVDLTGVFQFDGRTTRGITKRIYEHTIGAEDDYPVDFETLADINALSRPGALISGMTGKYEKVEQGKAKPEKHHPAVAEILSSTHGCLVYQEQVMKIGSIVGGFPGDKVGALRKIIGKKKAGGAFEEFYEEFRKGAEELHGIPAETARQLWDWMATSSSYLFNIAHAIAYAVIAYWSMYLKVHYPAEFYAASLRYAKKSKERDIPLELMQDSTKHHIQIHPPRIDIPRASWHVGNVKGNRVVRAGLSQLPGVGPAKVPEILAWCEEYETYRWEDLEYKAGRKGRKTLPDEPSYGVSGLGAKKIAAIKEFAEAADPFGIHAASEACRYVINGIARGDLPLPPPTGDANWLGNKRAFEQDVTFVGLIREVRIIDVVEAERKRTNLSAEKVRETLKQPHLATKAKIIASDHAGAEVHINVDRYLYPELAVDLNAAAAKRDVVHVQGVCREAYGPTVQARSLVVIELKEMEAA